MQSRELKERICKKSPDGRGSYSGENGSFCKIPGENSSEMTLWLNSFETLRRTFVQLSPPTTRQRNSKAGKLFAKHFMWKIKRAKLLCSLINFAHLRSKLSFLPLKFEKFETCFIAVPSLLSVSKIQSYWELRLGCSFPKSSRAFASKTKVWSSPYKNTKSRIRQKNRWAA
jgi:hypothetical protein